MSHQRTMWNLSAAAVSALFLVLLPSMNRLHGAEFIRGDANGDGMVSLADGLFIYFHEFLGGPLPCPDAADANDDESVDIRDYVTVARLMVDGAPLPSPFPALGADPTTGTGSKSIDCPSYGGESPTDDSRMRLEVIDSVVDPEDGARTYLFLAVTSPIQLSGVSGSVRFAPGQVTSGGEARSFVEGFGVNGKLSGDLYSFTVLPGDPKDAKRIPAGHLLPLLEVPLCLAPGPEGRTPMVLDRAELVDSASRSIRPVAVDGVLVAPAITEGDDCSAPPPPPPPPPINAVYRLDGGTAPPGGEAIADFFIRADAEIQGYAYSIDFDEEVLQATSVEEVWRRPDGLEFGFKVYEMNNKNLTPGNAGVDEGFLIGAVIFNVEEYLAIPANTDNHVLRFRLQVAPEATAQATEFRFIDGGKGRGQPVPNRVTANGLTEYTRQTAESFVFVSGRISVLPDVVSFVRGDSNGDAQVDVSDAQATLGWLFLGESAVTCFDAADADDSGALDITDPLATLGFLFLGAGPLPPPYPAPGIDPTADRMGCLQISS